MQTSALKVNRRIRDLIGSSTLAITARAKELKAQGRDVVNFAGGEPDFDTPEPIKQAAIEAIKSGFTKYTPSTGTQELRDAISAKFQKDNGLTYKPGQIAVSCGAKHSLYNVIQVLVDDGDEVIIPAPYWVSYPEMVKAAGGVNRFVQTSRENNFKITAEQLDGSITKKTKLFLLNSPSNPTGVLYSQKEITALAEVCAKNRIYVLSDEIYEKLVYDGETFTSIGALGKEIFDLTITVNGVSKAYAMTGWRIGYAAGPAEIMDYVKKFQDHSTSNPTSISQVAALQALKAPEDSVVAMRNEFQKRRDAMMKAVGAIPQISYVRPGGAFYLFCDFSSVGNTEAIAKRILDDVNVAVIPGDGFGAPGWIRLSFSTSMDRIQEGVRRIDGWIKNIKAKI
ncbi:MAG: pyridoxal phosphate-dependent aminotransferase [Candidatus Omnitrophota bacterium]|nr:pyridoxal phosphate-dependent aminotransferase [Candidatus Omnitrophota bacterium]MDZ4241308.1 pyridoxal phosphate-dependent aminotransferase [Candidatus Omnitrophota bacterium]